MTYRECIANLCTDLQAKRDSLFIGYNTSKGSRMYGTLDGVPESSCIETPVAENLMTGLAIGLALDGAYSVLCFERHDFILNALDSLVNHADKLYDISGGEVKLPILVRAIVGDSSTLDVGLQHKQNYCNELKSMLKYTPVVTPKNAKEFKEAFNMPGHTRSGVVVVVEYRSQYDDEIHIGDGE